MRECVVAAVWLFGLVAMGEAKPLVDPPMSRWEARRYAILRRVPKDRSALVNVRLELLPATPDLTRLGKRALPALEWAVTNNTNGAVRFRIASVLWALRDFHSHSALLAATKDWNDATRDLAVRALGDVGGPGALERLLSVARGANERSWIRADAVLALGRLGDGRAAPALAKIFLDSKGPPWIRQAALKALWDLRFVTPRSLLERVLVAAIESDVDAWSRFASGAVAALGLRSRRVRTALLRNLNGRSSRVANAVVYALGLLGDRKVLPALRRRLDSVRTTRLLNNVVFALFRLEDPKAMDVVRRLLKHSQAVIRLNAAFVAGDLGRAELVSDLVRATRDPSLAVRASAIAALARLASRRDVGPQGREALVRAARSRQLSVALTAYEGLMALALRREASGRTGDGRRLAGEILARFERWPTANVRCRAARIAARAGDPRAITSLVRCGAWKALIGPASRYPARTLRGQLLRLASSVWTLSGSQRYWVVGRLLEAGVQPGHLDSIRALLPVLWRRPGARRAVARLLGRLGDRGAEASFWRLLESRDVPTRWVAAYGLVNLGVGRGVRILATALSEAAPSDKRLLALLLRRVRNPGSASAVRKAMGGLLQGHGTATAVAAAFVLTGWQQSRDRAMARLVGRLLDPRAAVRQEAAWYLLRREMRPFAREVSSRLRAAARGGKVAVQSQERVVEIMARRFLPGFLRPPELPF